MHDHLDESNSRDADVFEVVWVGSPWSRFVEFLEFVLVIAVQRVADRIDELDGVFNFCKSMSVDCLPSPAHRCLPQPLREPMPMVAEKVERKGLLRSPRAGHILSEICFQVFAYIFKAR